MLEPGKAYKVLICDLIGLERGEDGLPYPGEARAHIEALGGRFHTHSQHSVSSLEPGRIHTFYLPDLSSPAELLHETTGAGYDALICAATVIPEEVEVGVGAVRIGTGTGNMRSRAWGGTDGRGGGAALMNTPGINARATAQMVMKAVLRQRPDLPFEALQARVLANSFDTGLHLRDFPTRKLEGQRLAVLGYGNIGREVAKLARSFGMRITVHARSGHRRWIESEGFRYAASATEAARDADVLSVHLGLGRIDPSTGKAANVGLVGIECLKALSAGAMVVNFDRGEITDVEALEAVLASGQVSCAAIDADVFLGKEGPAGPLAPYLPLADRYPGRLLLLPHAAADTDHSSRVDGSKLAASMVFDLLSEKRVHNLVGDLPDGFTDAGIRVPRGIGKVALSTLLANSREASTLATIIAQCGTLASFYERVLASEGPTRQALLTSASASEAIIAGNRLCGVLNEAGLVGPHTSGDPG